MQAMAILVSEMRVHWGFELNPVMAVQTTGLGIPTPRIGSKSK